MARSYVRRGRRGRGGLLVREAAVQRGVQTNSLFSVPVAGTATADGSAVGITGSTGAPTSRLLVGSTVVDRSKYNIVRMSSITVASRSPFILKVRAPGPTERYLNYQIEANKPTKITFSRENSIAGNAALLAGAWSQGGLTSTYSLVQIARSEDPVDIKLNMVVDSSEDD